MAIAPSGSRGRCARSRRRGSLPATATMASGRRWTRCATAITSSSSGARAELLGGHGHRVVSIEEASGSLGAATAPPSGRVDPGFWRDRRVLLTGHTGFKGAWLALWLQSLGARVTGFSVNGATQPSLFELARVGEGVESIQGDVRDP